MIELKALINATPFSEEKRGQLLSKLETMTESEKFRLSEICWTALSTLYQLRLKRTINFMMYDMAQGKKEYSRNDFEEAKAKLYYEFAQKLDVAETEVEMAEVKSKLENAKAITPPTSTPK